jgi:DnaJ like chaperone protein
VNFWGKIVGGAAGLAIGGPIGGVIGAVAGHAYDRFRKDELKRLRNGRSNGARATVYDRSPRRQAQPYDALQSNAATALIVLGAKLAKADGVVSREEIRAFRSRFMISEQLVGGVGHIYNQAKNTSEGFEPYARQLHEYHAGNQAALEEVIVGLFEVALSDGELHPNELQYLREVATLFEIEPSRFAEIRQTFLQISGVKDPTEDAYRLLGVQRESTDADIKKAYRELVRELHPDRLTARKFSPHIIDQATMCLAAINGAYDKIAKERGIR